MKGFKGIPMSQFIVVALLCQFFFVCVDANYPQTENQLVSKAGDIQRHLVDVSPHKKAGNVSPHKKTDSVSPTINIATDKGNVGSPIGFGNHYRKKMWSSGKWLQGLSNRKLFRSDGSMEDTNFMKKIDKIDVERKHIGSLLSGIEDYDSDDNHKDDNINKNYDNTGDSDGIKYIYDNANENDDNDDDGDDDNNMKNDTSLGPSHNILPRGLGRIVTNKGRNKNKPVLPQIQTDTCECGEYNRKEVKNLRIVNGVETAKNQYPWMVSIRYTDNNHFCGGSIISDQFILTAAHCTHGMLPDEMQVTIGDHDLTTNDVSRAQTINVKEIFNYPEYDDFTTNNDLALLKLKKKIHFTWRVNPICLTPQDMTYYNEEVTVMGWGMQNENHKTGSPVLKHVQVKVLPMQKCRKDFHYEKEDISSKMLCAYEKGSDACQGDSGGPLVWKDPKEDRYFQIGATSWGIGCASIHHPGVYTKLTKFIDWIYTTAKDSTFCQTYIPKGAKRKYKGKNKKARLDKEQTEKMKAKKNKKENISTEDNGIEIIKFDDEELKGAENSVISTNNNNDINNNQEESILILGNDTDNIMNTTDKSISVYESTNYQGLDSIEGDNGNYIATHVYHNSTETINKFQDNRSGKSNDYDSTKVEEVKADSKNDTSSNYKKSSLSRQTKKVKENKSNRNRKSKKKIKDKRKLSKKKMKGIRKYKSPGKDKRKNKYKKDIKNASGTQSKGNKREKIRKQKHKSYRKKNDKNNKQNP